MSATYYIREAQPSDLRGIWAVYERSYQQILGLKDLTPMYNYDRAAYGDSYPFSSLRHLKEFLSAMKHVALDNRIETIWVAAEASNVYGFVYAAREGPLLGSVVELHVHSNHQHKGIGSALLAQAEDWIFQRMAGVIVEAHDGVVSYFISKGYVPLSTLPELYMGHIRYTSLAKLMSWGNRGISPVVEAIGSGNIKKAVDMLLSLHREMEKLGLISCYIESIIQVIKDTFKVNETQNIHTCSSLNKYVNVLKEKVEQNNQNVRSQHPDPVFDSQQLYPMIVYLSRHREY